MAIAEKVYDYKVEKVKSQVLTAFKKRKNESTISDLITMTGLPKYQVEQTTKLVCDEYSGHMKVTESGEILYYFPKGMKSRYHGFSAGAKRFFKGLFLVLGKVLKFLFKVWIMLMLVFYFVLFIAIIVAAILLAMAASANSKSRSRRGGSGSMMFIVLQLLQVFLRIFFWVQITKDTSDRQKPKGRPFYKSVFGFVFGDEDPNKEFNTEEKIQLLSFIRSNKGVITAEELMTLTGKDYSSAQAMINTFLVEYEGEPMVTDRGTLYYFFPELLKTSKKEMLLSEVSSVSESKRKKLVPFSENKGKSNGIIIFFNGFNLLFGSYFTFFSLIGIYAAQSTRLGGFFNIVYTLLCQEILGIADPSGLILIVLGIIPLAFSATLYLVPIIRNILRSRKNEKIKKENLSKKLYTTIYYSPVSFNPLKVQPSVKEESVSNPVEFVRKTTDSYAGIKHAEITVTDRNETVYNFNELEEEIKDIAKFRQIVNTAKYEVGDTVFDSGADL